MALAGVVAFVMWRREPVGTGSSLLQNAQVSQVTVTGNAWRPVLSPDGKYVVYIRRDGTGRSLRLRQLGTDRDVELAASTDLGDRIQAATVTPDGSFVDFIRGNGDETTFWRVPFLGGAAKRVLDDVSSPIGWSPDGRQLCVRARRAWRNVHGARRRRRRHERTDAGDARRCRRSFCRWPVEPRQALKALRPSGLVAGREDAWR